MRYNERHNLERKTNWKYWFLRFSSGIYQVIYNRKATLAVGCYLLLVMMIYLLRNRLFGLNTGDIFAVLKQAAFGLTFPFWSVFGLFAIIVKFGTPYGAKQFSENLNRAGITNHAKETPLLLSQRRDSKSPQIMQMVVQTNGIPLSKFEDECAKIESSLNINIIKATQGADKQSVVLHAVPGSQDLPKTVYWKDSFLSKNSFELVLGESLLGRETMNLSKIPHILLGGSTGSGKSVLLKLLIMQCVKKGAKIYIADFKGGIDFPGVWHEKCRIVIDEKELLIDLTNIVDELEKRKEILRESECNNIDEYNQSDENKLQRIVFACDEVAEVLDKVGLSKESKERVAQIESKLSIIARQGRAFGIHLILATQRPDATILSGQIRNNINYRICGRADNVLSQIILDNTDAADKIPKFAQGRFLTHEGMVFQGYLFDEGKAFGG